MQIKELKKLSLLSNDSSIFRVVFFLIFFLFYHYELSAKPTSGVFLNWESSGVKIEQIGQAPSDAPDKERIAKRHAIIEAVRTVVGEEIKSRSLIKNFSLIHDIVYTKMGGFAKNVHAIGGSRIREGIYYQNFSLIVIPPALDKALVEASIEENIDVPLIYEMIESPRIAMAITEIIVDESGKKHVREPDFYSESKIQEYFKVRNPDFYFISIPALSDSVDEKPDWIALGKKNNFDVIIGGEVRTSFLLKAYKNVRGVGKDIKIPMYRYSSELTWNIINLSRAEREVTVHDVFSKGSKTEGSGEVSAQNYAKSQVLEKSVPKLFRKLMLNWVNTVYYSEYQIIFNKTLAQDDKKIGTALKSIQYIVPESLHSRGSTGGKLTYNLRVQGALGDLTSSLNKSFPEYKIDESRAGKIVLSPFGSKPNIFQLKIENSSFTQSNDYWTKLRSIQGIWDVTEPTLSEGTAIFNITSSESSRGIALKIEKKLSLRIITLERNMIKAKSK